MCCKVASYVWVEPGHNVGLEIVTAITPRSGSKMEMLTITRYTGG